MALFSPNTDLELQSLKVGNWRHHHFQVLSVRLEGLASHFSCSSPSSNKRHGPHHHRECLSYWFLILDGIENWSKCTQSQAHLDDDFFLTPAIMFALTYQNPHTVASPLLSKAGTWLFATGLAPTASLLLKVLFQGHCSSCGQCWWELLEKGSQTHSHYSNQSNFPMQQDIVFPSHFVRLSRMQLKHSNMLSLWRMGGEISMEPVMAMMIHKICDTTAYIKQLILYNSYFIDCEYWSL